MTEDTYVYHRLPEVHRMLVLYRAGKNGNGRKMLNLRRLNRLISAAVRELP